MSAAEKAPAFFPFKRTGAAELFPEKYAFVFMEGIQIMPFRAY
jgi:hypothetical protein